MRARSAFRSLVVAALVAVAPGCFVFDEIDAAGELSKGPAAAPAPGAAKAGAAKPGAAKAGASAAGANTDPAAPSAKGWWQTARTLGSEQSDEGISRCDLGGRTEFMLRDDCLVRGGAPK